MTPWEWLEEAVTKEFVVLDVENYFWADRKRNDLPLLSDGRPYMDAQDDFERTRGNGKQSQGEVKYRYQLSPELLDHVTRWEDYCYAIGFMAPGLPALVWSELSNDFADRRTIGRFILSLVRRVPIVAHNSAHDVRIINKNWGIPFSEYMRVDDSMLLHNVLWSELPHTLNFCSGVYSSQNQHKDLGTHSLVYLHGDVRTTAEVWWNLKKEAERDDQSWRIYETLQRPMLPLLLDSHQAGVRLNKAFLFQLHDELLQKRESAVEIANAFVREYAQPEKLRGGKVVQEGIEPDPERKINMNSPKQMNDWVYGKLKMKIKGLRKSKKSGMYPLGKDEIAKLQDQYYPRDDDDTFELRLKNGGHPLIEAKAEFTQADKFLTGYILPYLKSERVHPQFKLHGQATGRWSTTNPNLPGMNKRLKPIIIPDVGHVWVGGDWSNAELRIMGELTGDELLIEGFAKGWDLHSMHASQAFGWDNPKGRYEWAKMLRKIEGTWDDWKGRDFDRSNGWWGRVGPTSWKETKVPVDFPWEEWVLLGGPQPGWLADEDPFRRFCKILVFRLMYGGSVDAAADIPGAIALGLPPARLVQASKDLILAHPWWQEFWDDVGGQARKLKIVRNWNGRARRLMSIRDANRFREGVNFPIQSWVSDLLNKTLLEIKALANYARMVYTCHDSFYMQCPAAMMHELIPIVNEVAQRPLRGDFFIPFDEEVIRFDEVAEKRHTHKVRWSEGQYEIDGWPEAA